MGCNSGAAGLSSWHALARRTASMHNLEAKESSHGCVRGDNRAAIRGGSIHTAVCTSLAAAPLAFNERWACRVLDPSMNALHPPVLVLLLDLLFGVPVGWMPRGLAVHCFEAALAPLAPLLPAKLPQGDPGSGPTPSRWSLSLSAPIARPGEPGADSCSRPSEPVERQCTEFSPVTLSKAFVKRRPAFPGPGPLTTSRGGHWPAPSNH